MGVIEGIDAPGAGTRVTRSTISGYTVTESPAALFVEAQARVPGITRDEYTLARILSSEYGSGPTLAVLAIGDATLNRAQAEGRSVFDHATQGNGYGRQGANPRRPVSTSLDPLMRHVRAAQALTRGGQRGFSRGARRFFDPRVQYACWSKPTTCVPNGSAAGTLNKSQHPLVVLDSWCWGKSTGKCDRDELNRYRCEHGPRRAPVEEWVGPIAGIDAWELMLMRPATAEHGARYEQATQFIAERIGLGGVDAIAEVVRNVDPALLLLIVPAVLAYAAQHGVLS